MQKPIQEPFQVTKNFNSLQQCLAINLRQVRVKNPKIFTVSKPRGKNKRAQVRWGWGEGENKNNRRRKKRTIGDYNNSRDYNMKKISLDLPRCRPRAVSSTPRPFIPLSIGLPLRNSILPKNVIA